MESNIEYDIQEHINHWSEKLRSESSITESDAEELKSHLLDIIDELEGLGLKEEEAFLIASRRMGRIADWDEDYREANNPIIQMRKSLVILAGILVYFLLYYFIEFSSKLLLLILLSAGKDGYLAVSCISRYLIGALFVFILFAASIYFLEKKTVSFIENVKMKPRHTLLLLLTTVIFCITDTCLFPIVKNLIGQNRSLMSHLYHVLMYFDFTFPLLICISFIFLYFKYYKKTKF